MEGIITGDARELAAGVEGDSIDLIITDPPWLPWEENKGYYRWLGKEAVRVLKPGRYLFTYAPIGFLPEVFSLLDVPGLVYFWTFVIYLVYHPKIWEKKVHNNFMVVLGFTKGEPAFQKWQGDVFRDEMDKRFHEWGKGVGTIKHFVELFSEPGELVFDPFCGGGAVPVAAKELGRRFLAFEVDERVAELARRRVEGAQSPLFALAGEQLVLPWKG